MTVFALTYDNFSDFTNIDSSSISGDFLKKDDFFDENKVPIFNFGYQAISPHQDQWIEEQIEIKIIDEISDKSIDVIGINGLNRFQEFKRYLKGWDFGIGEPLSYQSVAIFDTFLNLSPFLFEKEPSIFLTRAGNLQLAWEDYDDRNIEVEFYPNKIEYFIEAKDVEGEIELNKENIIADLAKLISKLKY
jgi:hypothetical protein